MGISMIDPQHAALARPRASLPLPPPPPPEPPPAPAPQSPASRIVWDTNYLERLLTRADSGRVLSQVALIFRDGVFQSMAPWTRTGKLVLATQDLAPPALNL